MNDLNNNKDYNDLYTSQSVRRKKRSKWWIPILIIGILFIMIIGGIISFLGYFTMSLYKTSPIVISEHSVLYLDLKNIEECHEVNPLSIFNNELDQPSFYEIIEAIKMAKMDNNICGIYYESRGNVNISYMKSQELQQVLNDFKSSGKFIYSYLEIADEIAYYNALPSDSIFVSDESMILLNGFGLTSFFLKGLFDKIGIEYSVVQCEDYKSAGEQYVNKKFSDSARYQNKILIEQREKKFIDAVSKYRGISQKDILTYIGNGFTTIDSLITYKFIDVVSTPTDVIRFINGRAEKHGDDMDNFIHIDEYVTSLKEKKFKSNDNQDNQIAVIYGNGPIVSQQEAAFSAFGKNQAIVADDFIDLLKNARDNDKIKAIILRINSPGGSVIASEAIYQEILKTKLIKPVYASMGDVAASGGYYIAMACDTIIASEQTITGSIGVITAIPNFNGTLNKLEINIDTISTGHGNPFFLNPFLKTSEREKAELKKFAYNTYYRFVAKAAQNRNKSFDDMRKLAKGRVWTGEDAYKNGLVDVLGGLQDAIEIAKKRTGMIDKNKSIVRFLPDENEKWERFLKWITKSPMNIRVLTNYFVNNNDSQMENIIEFISIPQNMKKQIVYNLELKNIIDEEKILVAMPYYLEIQ